MNCINNGIIQKYMDGEATPEEVKKIEQHLLTCEKCAIKVDHQRKLANGVKRAVNLLAKDTMEIPPIVIPRGYTKKHFFTTRRIIYTVAAACIIFFIIVISYPKEPENQLLITIEPGFAQDFNANRTVSQQSFVITIIDSEGNVTEYFN